MKRRLFRTAEVGTAGTGTGPQPRPSGGGGPAPLVIAHRGDSAAQAEHTLGAYTAAIEAGADGLECDVRLTKDGHLVCVHDRRVDRTSNGRGVVSEFALSDLETLDFASWRADLPESADELIGANPYFAGVWPERESTDGRVLRLETLLELAADADRPIRLAIETKHPTRYAGLVEKELVRVLRRFGHGRAGTAGEPMEQLVAVMSFSTVALRRVRLLAPALPTVLLREKAPLEVPPAGTRILGPSCAALHADPDGVARMHRAGRQVYVWTVDRAEDIALALDLGVDAIISNRPRDVLAARANRTPTPPTQTESPFG